ncbi:MAG: hypothetical protein KGS72_10715 [Cyanobacteria bacterium REEB67]|nr:hypothetical protein [Cyanobacteria bacterium REEB67]
MVSLKHIYIAKDGDQLIILFGGGTKKHQEADIEEAKRLHKQYKYRKAKLKADEDRPKAEKDKSTRKGGGN